MVFVLLNLIWYFKMKWFRSLLIRCSHSSIQRHDRVLIDQKQVACIQTSVCLPWGSQLLQLHTGSRFMVWVSLMTGESIFFYMPSTQHNNPAMILLNLDLYRVPSGFLESFIPKDNPASERFNLCIGFNLLQVTTSKRCTMCFTVEMKENQIKNMNFSCLKWHTPCFLE